ncbi:MAG: HAD-IA family hydrolase [Tetrasphaera sp.]|nr:HAD-IA family hydrolase [Tetrasphaera sp.]
MTHPHASSPVPNATSTASSQVHGLDLLEGRRFAAVLFDLDGTLIDSTAAIARCWAAWAPTYGIELSRLRGLHGIPARGIIERLLTEDRRDEAEQHIRRLELDDVSEIPTLPGAVAALEALAGARHAIATSCTDDLAQARIGATGLPRPPVVITASDVARGKPAPDPYLLAAERLGADPRDCLVVEDAPLGLESARAAGCATLAVTTTTAYDQLVADPNADAVIPDLAAVHFSVTGDGRVRLAPGRP